MAYDIFEAISTAQYIDFTDNFTPGFDFFAQFLPEIRTADEYVRITDYDIDFNPPAQVVGDNTEAPLLQRPTYESAIQDLQVYKVKHVLSDSEIRRLKAAATNAEKETAKRLIFGDQARLLTAHAIAREKWRARALFEGKYDFSDENFRPKVYDYGIPADQFIDIDFEKDDILEKLAEAKKLVADRTGKQLGLWLLSNEDIFKLCGNESLRTAIFGKANKDIRRLTRAELSQALELVNITFMPIQDEQGNNYHYTDNAGNQILFVPINKSILLPNIQLGYTVTGMTAEEMVLGEEGYKISNTNGVTIFPIYQPTPVHFELNAVSRFTVIYPKANCSVVITDTSTPIGG